MWVTSLNIEVRLALICVQVFPGLINIASRLGRNGGCRETAAAASRPVTAAAAHAAAATSAAADAAAAQGRAAAAAGAASGATAGDAADPGETTHRLPPAPHALVLA